MPLYLSRYDYNQMLIWARNAHPAECCGLIWGSCDEGEVFQIDMVEWTENLAHNPLRYFEIDPKSLIIAAKKVRNDQKQLLGYFHSHPNGVALPSQYDAEMADIIGMIWIIIANDEITVWLRHGDGIIHGAFKAIDIEIMA